MMPPRYTPLPVSVVEADLTAKLERARAALLAIRILARDLDPSRESAGTLAWALARIVTLAEEGGNA